MSDPTKPPSEQIMFGPIPAAPMALWRKSDSYCTFWERKNRNEQACKDMLKNKNLVPANSVVLDPAYTLKTTEGSKKEPLAACQSGPGNARLRSTVAARVLARAYAEIPTTTSLFEKAEVEAKMESTIRIQAPGIETTMGRLAKYVPEKEHAARRIPTEKEVSLALTATGMALTGRGQLHSDVSNVEALRLWPLIAESGGKAIKITRGASNGLPTLGDTDNPALMRKVFGIARDLRGRLEKAYQEDPVEGVERLYQRLLAGRTSAGIVTLLGKAKSDYYSIEKADGNALRFYCVWPRCTISLFQQGWQPMKECAYHILSTRNNDPEEGKHTAQGMSLLHGGADALVAALDAMLEEGDLAYVHSGDDGLIVVEHHGLLLVAEIDFSAFDLTQEGAVFGPIKRALADQHKLWDPAVSQLWYAMNARHRIIMHHACAYDTSDMGLSGGVGQDKINDMGADIFCQRLERSLALTFEKKRLGNRELESVVQQAASAVGDSMGLKVKLVINGTGNYDNLRHFLHHGHTKFVGYYLYASAGRVRPFADLPRHFGQMAFPKAGDVSRGDVFVAGENLRIASSVLSMGLPPSDLERAYMSLRADAIQCAQQALDYLVRKDLQLTDFAYSLEENPWGPEVSAMDAYGLLRALIAPPENLWLALPPTYRNPFDGPAESPVVEALSWADATQEEEERERKAMRRPKAAPLPPAVPVVAPTARRELAGPVTKATHGSTPRLPAKPERARTMGGMATGRTSAIRREYANPFDDEELVAQAEAAAAAREQLELDYEQHIKEDADESSSGEGYEEEEPIFGQFDDGDEIELDEVEELIGSGKATMGRAPRRR